jgi:oxygen-independent coproporphyrinogen III oxidase
MVEMHLYIHIPFCKKACSYCDFHFSTNLSLQDETIKAICAEIVLQKNFLQSNILETIYFGGGTPSLLSEKQLDLIFKTISEHYSLKNIKEITLEANPDDILIENLKMWKAAGINRLSIGVQSFDSETLVFMNRAHTSQDAITSLENSMLYFDNNLSLDLIYNRNAKLFDENEQHELLIKDLEILSTYKTNHISAYSLTIEGKTAMANWIEKGKLKDVSDTYAEKQYKIVSDGLSKLGYEQYEISNFARNGSYARHNTAYWQSKPYLGVGPSAHSFDGQNRYSNISNNSKYIKAIKENIIPQKIEILSEKDRFNDFVLCGLRTKWGFEYSKLRDNKFLTKEFWKAAEYYIQKGMLEKTETHLIISAKGRIFSDAISADLFA